MQTLLCKCRKSLINQTKEDNMNKENKHKYYNWQSLFYEDKHYDFIIGEHLKGRKYAMAQQKKTD